MYHEQGDSCNVMVAALLAVETLDTMAYNFLLIYIFKSNLYLHSFSSNVHL